MSSLTQPAEAQAVETRFGPFTLDEPNVIEFPGGIPGFETCTRFVLVASTDLAPFSCLQALDPPRPSFLVIDPILIDARWRGELQPAERARLGVEDRDVLLWLAIIAVTPTTATANLRAPLVINPRRMVGCQIIRDDSEYSTEHPIALG